MEDTKNSASPLPVVVSVLIVNYNRAQLLQHAIESVLNQTYTRFEIIVIENGSTDSSVDVVRSFESEKIRLIELKSNLGFAAGCNRGIQAAQGYYVALLNNDAVASPEWLSHLVKTAQMTPECGMWASKILFFGTDVIDKTGHLIYWDGQNRGRGTGEPDRGQYDDLLFPLFPDGCAGFYRKETLEKAGCFDEDFFAYADDADLGLRILWSGYRCRFVPEAVVYHHHSSTLGSFSPEKVFLVERNRLWLVIKNYPWFLVMLSPVFTLIRWVWNLVGAILGQGPAGNFRKRESIFSLAGTVLKANYAGIMDLKKLLSKRRKIFKSRKISTSKFFRLIWRCRISARQLALKDRDV